MSRDTTNYSMLAEMIGRFVENWYWHVACDESELQNMTKDLHALCDEAVREDRGGFMPLFSWAIDALEEHRRDAFTTCPEDCWCWEVEALTTRQEEILTEWLAMVEQGKEEG